MNSGLWWLFDGIVVILAGYVLFSNAKRGATKVLVMAIGYVVATLLASFLSSAAAPTLYKSVARRTNLTAFETVNSHVDLTKAFTDSLTEHQFGFVVDPAMVREALSSDGKESFELLLYHYANESSGSEVCPKDEFYQIMRDTFLEAYDKELGDRLPKYVRQNFIKQISENSAVMRSIVKELYNPRHSEKQHAELMEDLFSKDPSTEVLQIFVYLIIFSVLMVIAAVISAMLQNRIFLNLRNSSERLLGGVLGVLEASAMVILLTLIIRLIVMLSGDELRVINNETIIHSKVFSFFYEHVRVLI